MKKRVTRWLGLLLSFAMLLMTFQMAVMAAGDTNLCVGIVPELSQEATKNETAKATQAAALTDGKIANGYSNSAWFIRNNVNTDIVPTATFDLGEEKKVGKWVITGASSFQVAFAKKYDISYSTDGENWTVATAVENNTNYASTTEFANITARYWRLTVYFTGENNTDLDKANPYEQVRISEIEMYEGEDAQDFGVEITTPADLYEVDEGNNLTLEAAVSGAADSVTRVEFSIGNNTVAAVKDMQDNSIWTAEAENLSAGDYSITAVAYVGESFVRSEPVSVRVHATTYTNIAQGKPAKVSVISTGDASGIVDGDNAASTGTHVWFVNGTMINSTPSNGATAEIDLAGGYPNTFLLQFIKLYTGGNGDPAVSDFALYYKLGEEWVEAVSETGNTEGVYTYTFPEEVEADAVRFVCNTAGLKLRVREIEVYGKLAKPQPPTVTVTSTNMTVSTNEVEITAGVETKGSAVSKIGAELNGTKVDAQVTESGNLYKVKVGGLQQGTNSVIITAENAAGLSGRSETVTVTYDPGMAGSTTVEITTPKEAIEVSTGEPFTLTAQVSGQTEDITAVQFSVQNKVIAEGRKRTDGRWTATLETLENGTHNIIATAYIGGAAAGVSEAVQITVSDFKGTVISERKPVKVSVISTGSAAGIVDGDTASTTGDKVWFVNGEMVNTTPSDGATAEIDLANGSSDIFSIERIKVYSGGSAEKPVPGYTLYYKLKGEWIEAAVITGNTQDLCETVFPQNIKATAVRFVCNIPQLRMRVREIQVVGRKARAGVPVVTVPSLVNGNINVFESAAVLTAAIDADGSKIREIGAELNGEPTEIITEAANGEYTLEISGLVSGANTVVLLAENLDGTVGYSEPFTLTYYNPDLFMETFTTVKTEQELGQFILDNMVMLGLENDDYTNQEKYGRIYSGVLKVKNKIKTIADFLSVFEENKKLEQIRTADGEHFIEQLHTVFPEIDVSMVEAASDNIQKSFAAMVTAAEFHTVEELANCVKACYALSKIKYTPWNGLAPVLEQYHTYLELADYQEYAALKPEQKSYANQMIAANRTSSQMNTKEGFKEIFADAVEKGKNYTSGNGAGNSGGSSLGAGGRGSGSTLSVPPNMTAPNTVDVNYYSDVNPSHEAWNAITYMTKTGKIQGVGNGQFLPEASITREEFVKILVEALFAADTSAITSFQDVAADSWYYKYVATAQKLGVVNGISETAFGSGTYMTREELATLVYRAATVKGITLGTEESSAAAADEDDISTWAYYPIYALRRSGMITGETVRPRDRATRAEAVQLLYQMILMEG